MRANQWRTYATVVGVWLIGAHGLFEVVDPLEHGGMIGSGERACHVVAQLSEVLRVILR